MRKGPSFVPNLLDINWHDLRQDVDKFVNKIRYTVKNIGSSQDNDINTSAEYIPYRKSDNINSRNFRVKETSVKALETFLENVERDLLNTDNLHNVHDNLNAAERIALKEIKNWEDKVVRVQDKGSRFVIMDKEDYVTKVNEQIARSSFIELNNDTSTEFQNKVKA